MEEKLQIFLKELEESEEEGWKVSVDKKNIRVAKKKTPNTDVYRMKMVGELPFPPEVVYQVLLDPSIRTQWDKYITSSECLIQLENGLSVYHICTRCPPGITNRDLLHLRIENKDPENGVYISLDKSVSHPDRPEGRSYIRAHTIFSGLVLSRKEVNGVPGTRYAAISQADIRGDVPVIIVNATASKGTVDWFAQVEKVCGDFVSGKIKPKAV